MIKLDMTSRPNKPSAPNEIVESRPANNKPSENPPKPGAWHSDCEDHRHARLPPPVTKTQIYKQARLHLNPPTNKLMVKAAQMEQMMQFKNIFQHPPHIPSPTYDPDLQANDKAQTIMYEGIGACGKKCNEDNENTWLGQDWGQP